MIDGKAIVRHHLLVGVSEHRPDVWDEIMAPDFVMHVGAASRLVTGRDAYKAVLAVYWEAFPDLSIELLQIIGEDDLVAAHYVERGTQTGPFGRIAATGRSYAKNGLGLYRVGNAQLAEAWIQEDDLTFMRELGIEDFGYS
ncbi:MAG: ester cyclase [Acidimicrobiales bacterium]